MSAKIDPDLWRSASHQNQIQHLTGPFAAGAVNTRLVINRAGNIDLTESSSELLREPMVLASLANALEDRALRVRAVLNPDISPVVSLQELEFSPYTEAGASLPLYLPPVDPDTKTASGFKIGLTLIIESSNEEDSTSETIAADEIGRYLEVHLLQGIMGRMLYLMSAEKQRIRRQAREIISMQSLSLARDNALDRFGADLGVPRFMDFLRYRKPEPGEAAAIFNQFKFGERRFGAGFGGEIIAELRREPDNEYRRRLAIYNSFLLPNYQQIVELLNGPGAASEPNRGLLSALGLKQRFEIIERDNDLSIAVHIVAAGDIALRNNFLDYVRKTYLIFPNRNASTDQWHYDRPSRQTVKQQIAVMRTRISQNFDFSFDPEAAIAPMLAAALDRVGQCRKALGVATPWRILRAQDSRIQADGGSSRYELGLGIEVEIPSSAELDRMVAEHTNPAHSEVAPEIDALLKSMVPAASTDDPEGYWLLKPCGIQTCHRTKNGLYLSHLPFYGLEITGAASVTPGIPETLSARHKAPGDAGKNFILVKGLETALASWTAAGNEPWTVLPDAAAQEVWSRSDTPGFRIVQILAAAGLTTSETTSIATIVERLRLAVREGYIPEELFETIQLPTTLTRQILAGQEDSIAPLRQLVRLLRQQGISALLPLVTRNDEIVLVIAVTALPGVGLNISERRTSAFRWYVIPIYPGKEVRNENSAPTDVIGSTGSQTQLKLRRSGLVAVVAVGNNRQGLTDPYQFRVQANVDTVLNLQQYEYLMNLLQHLHPLGVEIDTFAIRQNNVDLDGDGYPEPLQLTISRTYRQFRRLRYRGYDVGAIENKD